MGIWYATREQVKRALDAAETARNDEQVDRAIEASSRDIDGGDQVGGLLRRRFYPEIDTRFFDWPNDQYARPWRLWLDGHELISVTSLTVAGVVIPSTDYFLEPANEGPPFDCIEIDLGSSASFHAGDTHQRAIAIVGTFGSHTDDRASGALAEALDDTETGVDVTDSSHIGVGSLIKADSERMTVAERLYLDTGQNATALTASNADKTITGIAADTIFTGEVILVDAERMLVELVAGTSLVVRRAWDGSALAAHSGGADIYAPRTLTVTRGVLGTTAAAHSSAAAVTRHEHPPLVRDLCIAESLNQLGLEGSGYARIIGEGENAREGTGRSLYDLRKRVRTAHGRVLSGAV